MMSQRNKQNAAAGKTSWPAVANNQPKVKTGDYCTGLQGNHFNDSCIYQCPVNQG